MARHVPGRARNEPPRADAMTGQTSDCRPNVHGGSTGAGCARSEATAQPVTVRTIGI